MSTGEQFESASFETASANEPGGALVVDLDGYEGPIDMLLALARQQKVDLLHISILQLAEHRDDIRMTVVITQAQVRQVTLELGNLAVHF